MEAIKFLEGIEELFKGTLLPKNHLDKYPYCEFGDVKVTVSIPEKAFIEFKEEFQKRFDGFNKLDINSFKNGYLSMGIIPNNNKYSPKVK